jgi:hypothetical protein
LIWLKIIFTLDLIYQNKFRQKIINIYLSFQKKKKKEECPSAIESVKCELPISHFLYILMYELIEKFNMQINMSIWKFL